MAENWSEKEVKLIVLDYFSMLTDELSQKPINKTYHRNALLPLLNNRNDGSIEYKHRNISAVMIKLGLPFIRGYKPMWNYQKALEIGVIEYLNKNNKIEIAFNDFAEKNTIKPLTMFNEFINVLAPPPEKSNLVQEPLIDYQVRPIKINYLEKEQHNSNLGNAGESFAIQFERWRLIKEGKENLADKIEWISQIHGDGLGYDILSKNINGTDRYIEVKTTKLSKETPIYFSKREYETSILKKNDYYLYRVFNFNEAPKMFQCQGRFDEFCGIEPSNYKGYFQ